MLPVLVASSSTNRFRTLLRWFWLLSLIPQFSIPSVFSHAIIRTSALSGEIAQNKQSSWVKVQVFLLLCLLRTPANYTAAPLRRWRSSAALQTSGMIDTRMVFVLITVELCRGTGCVVDGSSSRNALSFSSVSRHALPSRSTSIQLALFYQYQLNTTHFQL